MHIEQKVNIHNRFDVEVRDAKTGELKQKATGFNIVLDQMWTRLCGGSSYFVNIHFGTGGGTLSPSRTSLFTHLGTKTAADEEQVKALPVSRWKRKIVLNPEEFVGSTITEVGIAFGSTASNLVTHAMLKDSEGNPISITKTDVDVVTIYATVFVTINNATGITMLGMPASNQLVNYLVGGSAAPTGSFGLLPGEGNGQRLGSTSSVTWTSDVPNKKRKTNLARFDINTANGDSLGYEFSNLFSVIFPNVNVFNGESYSNVPIGTGDGVKTKFLVPSKNLKSNSLVPKLNGTPTIAFDEELKRAVNFKHNLSGVPNYAAYKSVISPNGEIIAVSFNTSPRLFFFDAISFQQILTPISFVFNISDLAFSPDGQYLAVSVDTGVVLIKISDWTTVDIGAVATSPTVLEFSPDGSKLAVISQSAPYISLHDLVSKSRINIAQPPSGAVYVTKFTPDSGKLLVGVASSPRVIVFDVSNGSRVSGPIVNNGAVLHLGFSKDGTKLVIGMNASPYFVMCNTSDWSTITTTLSFSGTAFSYFNNDDSQLIVAFAISPYLKVYNTSNWSELSLLNSLSVPIADSDDVKFSKDGSICIIETTSSPNITIYNTEDWSQIAYSFGGSKPSLSEDNSLLLVTSTSFPYFSVFDTKPRLTYFALESPPPQGTAITADYTVKGVHKTNQFIIDASFAIAFGEGA